MVLSRAPNCRLALRLTQRKPILSLPTEQRRHIVKVPPLKNHNLYSQQGINGLYDKASFNLAWTNYETYLIQKINELTTGTSDETLSAHDLTIKYARWSDKSAIFNHASAAFNNHLYFSNITHEKTHPDATLLADITHSFSSLSSLKAEMIATAMAMFGPGYVWLVFTWNEARRGGDLKLLCTYIAGSPLPAAHWRHQPVDISSETTNVLARDNPQTYARRLTRAFAMQEAPRDNAVGTAGQFGNLSSKKGQNGVGGEEHKVLLGVSTWEHAWLRQEGISGKEKFLNKWWDCIDWEAVSATRTLAISTKTKALQPKSYSDHELM